MSKEVPKNLGHTSRVSIEAIRSQAEELLGLLDASGLAEAAALMATAIDAIDSSLKQASVSDAAVNDRID